VVDGDSRWRDIWDTRVKVWGLSRTMFGEEQN
jgi:hypothetical protein